MFSILTGCTGSDKPAVINGVLDLGNRDFQKDGSIEINGLWEFYPGMLLRPGDFKKNEKHNGLSYIKVPGMWRSQSWLDSSFPAKGASTYRLNIINCRDLSPKTLVLNRIYSAYRIWINGVLADEKGMPDTISRTGPYYVFIHNKTMLQFTPLSGDNEIVLQVVNYDYRSGGIGWPPYIENAEITSHYRFIKHTAEMIIVGVVLCFAVANLLFYLFSRGNSSALYLGLFGLMLAINNFNLQIPVLSGPLAFPRDPYLVDYLTVVLMIFFVMMTVRSLFYEDFFEPVYYIHLIITVPVILLLCIMDFKSAENLMEYYFIWTVFIILYHGYVFFKAVRNRRGYALLFSAAFIPMFAGGINDTLYAMWIIKTVNISQYTMVFFCITTTILAARRYTGTIQKLSDDLIEKNASLEKLDMIKDQFLANTSHELRTPLHGMIGLTESMLSGTSGELTPSVRENLSLIASSGHRLSDMVNDLLDMAKIQDGGISLNRGSLDLYRLSETVVKLSLPLLGDKPVEIKNDISIDIPTVLADGDRIRQVFHNLVGNAVKFTSKGRIVISARHISGPDCDAEMVEIKVSDTGIGVPEEFRESIFEAYSQADSGDARSYPGTGLGLAIAKEIIELHQGGITVAPAAGGGAVFTFTLPVWKGPEDDMQEATIIESMIDPLNAGIAESEGIPPRTFIESAFPGRPVFLVVDDDPVNIRVLQNYLESENCLVKTAGDGISALEIIEHDQDIDLVFLDIMMPVMSGYDVCRRIRLRHGPEELPVIMLTAKNMMADIDAAFSAGANDYIVKPFHASELLARAGTMLRLRNIRKSASAGITVHGGNTRYSFRFSEMIYITSHSKNIIIHTSEGDTELPVMMKDISDRLPPDIFIRIHKSYIINMQYFRSIAHVVSGRYRVRLRDMDDTELPVGPAYLDSLRKKI